MLHIALYEPEMPANTGNIIRLCANGGFQLHLIHPLGFILDDKRLRRAGLDYAEWTQVQQHVNYREFLVAMAPRRIFACTTKATQAHADVQFQDEDVFLLGPESRGLPSDCLQNLPAEQLIRIPMQPSSRSLNLSNAAAVIAYEAWRQLGFANHLGDGQ
jgi:tRNA (cytidine/uridine-2'-O-)-methyltransferase